MWNLKLMSNEAVLPLTLRGSMHCKFRVLLTQNLDFVDSIGLGYHSSNPGTSFCCMHFISHLIYLDLIFLSLSYKFKLLLSKQHYNKDLCSQTPKCHVEGQGQLFIEHQTTLRAL